MIKSSDPSFSNTYRIIKVLSNQDYLATDIGKNNYIFSQTHINADPPSSKHSRSLLTHRELITVDGLRYAVFAVGKEVLWASLIHPKRLQHETFVERLINHSCQNILKQLLWMGSGQAKNYLDLKNLWLIDQELCLLLVHRPAPLKLSIKKCEKRSLSHEKSINLLMDAERSLMKDFALALWQICFQCAPNQDKCITSHRRSKQLLRQMITKTISFEELLNKMPKKPQENASNKKSRLKSLVQHDSLRRNTLASFEKPYRLKRHISNGSILAHFTTENIERPFKSRQQSFARLTDSTPSRQSTIDPHAKSVSAEHACRQIGFRKSKYLSRHHTLTSSKESIQYDRWLQSRNYSVQIRQKLQRNGEIARKKFSQAIENIKADSQQEKLDDAIFKERVLAKVIKFKNAMKARQGSLIEEITANHTANQTIIKQQPQKNEEREEQGTTIFALKESQSQNSAEAFRQTTSEAQSNSNQNEKKNKIDNDYPQNRQKEDPLARQQKDIEMEKKKLNRINMLAHPAEEIEEDLEVVKLTEPAPPKPPQHQQNQSSVPQTQSKFVKTPPLPSQPISTPPQGKLVGAQAGVSQLLMLINTLGDITIGTVKMKDKLKEINWRQATYFLYERFHFERNRILDALQTGQVVCRKHRRVDPSDWKQYSNSKRQYLMKQMAAENEQITSTLNRLGQKLLREEQLERKIEYFVRNREKISNKGDSKLRAQLSKFLLSCIISEFDFVWEEKIKTPEVLTFLADVLFAAYVVGELDGVIPPQKFIRMDKYKEYDKKLEAMKPCFDYIDEVFFGKDEDWEVL